jgi:hypothetical protein
MPLAATGSRLEVVPTKRGTKRDKVKERASRLRRLAGNGLIEPRFDNPPERICHEEGCSVVLSRYNCGTYCHRHQRERVLDGRAKVNVSEYLDE